MSEILGVKSTDVATEHHQAVRDLAPGFIPCVVADDGIIEAIENPSLPQIIGVQWHPERIPFSAVTRKLFGAFVGLCREYRQKAEDKRQNVETSKRQNIKTSKRHNQD